MKKLNISPDLYLPLDAVTSTLVVYGGKGMGKTNLGAVLVEELSYAGLRWSALDPLGVWWGLRHSKDGSGPGIECVILGGVHGDIPIEPTGGAVAADLVVDETANVIIDFSRKPSGEMWSIGERVRFVTEYVKRLYQRQGGLADGKRREPIFQLLDEAARFIPQIIPAGNPDLAKCVSAWETLVEEGRNVGIGVGLLTQRSARMNKSVSEVADAMISFRIVGPNSIGAVMDWLGEHVPKDKIKQHIETLRSLERGRALVVSPGWLHFEGIANIRARETFDSSATPKPGERAQRVTGKAAKPDLAKYQERMKETIERAKENNPAELKKELARLRGELAKRPTEVQTKVEGKIVEVQVVTDEQVGQFRGAIEDLTTLADRLSASLLKANAKPLPKSDRMVMHTGKTFTFVVPKPKPVLSENDGNGHSDLNGPERKILRALAELLSIGKDVPSKNMVAAWSSYSPIGGAFGNPMGSLRTKGLIAYPIAGYVTLTDSGKEAIGQLPAPDQDEIWRRIENTCTGPEQKILRALIDNAGENEIAKETLAEKSGYSPIGGAFGNPIGALRTKGLLDYPRPGLVKAAEWLFI